MRRGYPPPHHSLLFKHWTLGPTSPLLANTQIQTQEIHKYRPRKYTNTHQGNTQIDTQEIHSFTKLLLVHCKNTAGSGLTWYTYKIFCDELWQNVEDKNVLWNCSQKRSPHLGARSKVWRAQITITLLSSGLCNKLTGIYHDCVLLLLFDNAMRFEILNAFISWTLKLCCTKNVFYKFF